MPDARKAQHERIDYGTYAFDLTVIEKQLVAEVGSSSTVGTAHVPEIAVKLGIPE